MSDAPAEEQPHKILDESVPTTGIEAEENKAADEFAAKKSPDGKLQMYIKVRSPFRSYYDGEAFSISGENATGPFDILPQHHNFISLLNACELIIRSQKGEQKIQIAGGLMHVKANQVIVFLDV
jgi:hypothetical protein